MGRHPVSVVVTEASFDGGVVTLCFRDGFAVYRSSGFELAVSHTFKPQQHGSSGKTTTASPSSSSSSSSTTVSPTHVSSGYVATSANNTKSEGDAEGVTTQPQLKYGLTFASALEDTDLVALIGDAPAHSTTAETPPPPSANTFPSLALFVSHNVVFWNAAKKVVSFILDPQTLSAKGRVGGQPMPCLSVECTFDRYQAFPDSGGGGCVSGESQGDDDDGFDVVEAEAETTCLDLYPSNQQGASSPSTKIEQVSVLGRTYQFRLRVLLVCQDVTMLLTCGAPTLRSFTTWCQATPLPSKLKIHVLHSMPTDAASPGSSSGSSSLSTTSAVTPLMRYVTYYSAPAPPSPAKTSSSSPLVPAKGRGVLILGLCPSNQPSLGDPKGKYTLTFVDDTQEPVITMCGVHAGKEIGAWTLSSNTTTAANTTTSTRQQQFLVASVSSTASTIKVASCVLDFAGCQPTIHVTPVKELRRSLVTNKLPSSVGLLADRVVELRFCNTATSAAELVCTSLPSGSVQCYTLQGGGQPPTQAQQQTGDSTQDSAGSNGKSGGSIDGWWSLTSAMFSSVVQSATSAVQNFDHVHPSRIWTLPSSSSSSSSGAGAGGVPTSESSGSSSKQQCSTNARTVVTSGSSTSLAALVVLDDGSVKQHRSEKSSKAVG